MKNNAVYASLGLAKRAGKLVSGAFSVEKAIKEKKAYLVLVAMDASENTKKEFSQLCFYYQIPILFFGKKEELGHAIGKELRTSVAILDKGFSNMIERKQKIMMQKEIEN